MAEGIALEDIGGEACEPVAGLVAQLSWALQKDFTTIVDPKDICAEDPDDAAASFSELVEIPAPGHVMAAGKKLWKVDFTTETGNIVTTQIGEKGRRLFENTLVVEIAGSESEILGFCRYIRNKKLMFFVPEFGSGNVRQLGSSRLGAWVEGIEAAIEAALEGKNAVTLTLKDKQKWPAPIYKGTLNYVATP